MSFPQVCLHPLLLFHHPTICFITIHKVASVRVDDIARSSTARPARCNWTCRRRSGSGKKPVSARNATRSRAAKRSALYDAMEGYANHFRPLLQAEMTAEQNEFNDQQAGLSNTKGERSPGKLFNLIATKRPRIFSSEVYSLSLRNGLSLPRTHTFLKGDLIDISLGGESDNNAVTIQGTVLSRSSRQLEVTFPFGSDASRRMDIFVEATVSLQANHGISVIAYERAINALDVFVRRGPGCPDLTRLLVMTLMKTSTAEKFLPFSQNPQDLVATNVSKCDSDNSVLIWNSFALETVPGISPADLSFHLKALSDKFNASQRAAIKRAVRSKVTLIQGPPGTGKTLTAAEIIAVSLRLGARRILAVAASNVAVDNLLRKTVRACDMSHKLIRIGKISSVSEDMWSRSTEGILERRQEVVQARNAFESGDMSFSDFKDVQKIATIEILREAHVVFATCVGSGIEETSFLEFDIVVVDEATQATEPDILIALTCGKNVPRQLVLVGDQHQLPPTVLSEASGENGLGLDIGLYLRLWLSGIQTELLNTQYRMHPAINAFPSARFYKKRVRDGVDAKDRPLPVEVSRRLKWLSSRSSVTFFPVNDGIEERDRMTLDRADGASLLNRAEANVVVLLVQALTKDKGTEIDIGVISPYSGQVKLLRDELLRKPTSGNIEINTVDGFQGREKDIIIISAVRSNEEGRIGFLNDWRRLNVALTRSRLMLIMVGNERTMRINKHWRSWLTWVRRHGSVVDIGVLEPPDPL